jgi:UDP:flavonoid glycosyltransferase YjiC (YdhE family)
MKVLFISHGSTGDIYPFIRFGVELLKHGHSVTFATSPLYKQGIESSGIEFYSVPPDWGHELFAEFMREINRLKHPALQLIKIYSGATPFLSELIKRLEDAIPMHDVVISSYMYPHYRSLAQKYNKPFGVFYFCHNFIPSAKYPPEPIPRLRGLPDSMQKVVCNLLWKGTSLFLDVLQKSTIGKELARHGYKSAKNWLYDPADFSLIAVSQTWMSNRKLLGNNRHITGYLRWQSRENPELEKELLEFTQGKRIPILNFGSVTFDGVHELMTRFVKNWEVGKKVIIQSGWAGLSVEVVKPYIKIVGEVSHDQLFKHASCVIHHGGAGTTASVLHAGVPQIIVPHIADQDFFASEVRRLRVGVSVHKKHWPEKLPREVRRIERSKNRWDRAQEIARELAKEDGASSAVAVIEEYVKNASSL